MVEFSRPQPGLVGSEGVKGQARGESRSFMTKFGLAGNVKALQPGLSPAWRRSLSIGQTGFARLRCWCYSVNFRNRLRFIGLCHQRERRMLRLQARCPQRTRKTRTFINGRLAWMQNVERS